MFYILDIDNTLLFTNDLNNKAYAFALSMVGLNTLASCNRITRDIIASWYPLLTKSKMIEIIDLKQSYVHQHLDLISVNEELYQLLQTVEADAVALWSAADPKRIESMLNYNNIVEYSYIRYSDKSRLDVCIAIQEFCKIFNCEKNQLCFYEDDQNVIEFLELEGVNVIEVVT